jgi:hypothetical protein
MNVKAQVNTPAKASAAPAAAHIPRPPVAIPEHEVEQPDMATQLEGAARLGHSLGAVGVASSAPPTIQRQELPEEEEEEELQMKREPAALQRQELPEEEEEEEDLHTKPAAGVQRQGGGEGFQLDDETAGRINRARGGGQPLEGALQEQMSASLGHDFSGVRVHTDEEADDLNQQLSAKAFTTGADIFFRRGEYNPGSASGRELIGHELTHVVQQSSGRVSGGGSGMVVRPEADAFEQEADVFGSEASQEYNIGAQQRAVTMPDLASPADILALQRTGGNQALGVVQASFARGLREAMGQQKLSRSLLTRIRKCAGALGLRQRKSGIDDVWRAVCNLASDARYETGGNPVQGVISGLWDCQSLTYLFIYLVGYILDNFYRPLHHVGGFTNQRRISRSGLTPNMKSIQPPNVEVDRAKDRYTFNSHTYAVIEGVSYDPLLGLQGFALNEVWPAIVQDGQSVIDGVTYDVRQTKTRPNGLVELELTETWETA